MNKQEEIKDFIENPSPLSKHLLEILDSERKNSEIGLNSRNPIKKLFALVKIRIDYFDKYKQISYWTNSFTIKSGIEPLFAQFQEAAKYIALNNLLLTYGFIKTKGKNISEIITKEDERLQALKNLYDKKQTPDQFRKNFGHFAFNGYELASKRFSEYSDSELITIAELLKDFKKIKKVSLAKYLESKKINEFWVYSALREELRFCALQVISELRFSLLAKGGPKVFQKKYEDLS